MNKTKFFSGLCIIVLAGLVAFNYSLNARIGNLSYVDLTKIEALASDEGGAASCSCEKPCGDGTIARCTGYQECKCNKNLWFVECDGVRSSC